MRTPRPKPNKLHDELDALLDGRPVELTDELAPLAEAADALRDELAAYQLDPQVADRHLERVLNGPGTVVELPARRQPNGWDLRRRVAAVALAAALVLAPATMASAAALPGQAMYPFKRAIEQLRIVSVQWSPGREAVERTRVADTRLDELQRLLKLQMYTQVPTALKALSQAVQEAKEAVDDAREEGEPVANVEARLSQVRAAGSKMVQQVKADAENGSIPLTAATRDAITDAASKSQVVLPPVGDTTPADPPSTGTPPPTTVVSGTDPTEPTPSSQVTPTTQATPTTKPEPPTTPTTPTSAPTTTEPPPTTPSTTEDTPSSGGTGGGDGVDGRSSLEVTPTTTVPGP